MTLQIGDYVKAKGERGIFKVMNIYKNGDISVYGGTTNRQMFRDFRAAQIQKKRKLVVR